MVRDWLMAQMTAFNATKSWRALIPTQRLESASALKARIPMRTVQDAKRYRTKQGGVPFPAGKAIRMRTMGLDAMFRVKTVDATMNGAVDATMNGTGRNKVVCHSLLERLYE